MGFQLPVLLDKKKRIKEQVDLTLVWPQVITALVLFGFSIGGLVFLPRMYP
jgi:hypothetical protein